MGIFKNPLQGVERFFRHPIDEITHPFGHHDQWKHAKQDMKDAGWLAAQAGLAVMTDGGSIVEEITAKQVAKKAASTWARNAATNTAGSFGKRAYKRVVNSKNPTNENSATNKKYRSISGVKPGAKLLYRSRYNEVYRNPDGKIVGWGRPTMAPSVKNTLLHPYSVGREWGENLLRWNPKYNKSDPVYRDLAKIHKKYPKMDILSGYSRGGAMANVQPYSKDTQYRMYGMYTPGGQLPDRRIRNRRSKKLGKKFFGFRTSFDPVHIAARYISKQDGKAYGRKRRYL